MTVEKTREIPIENLKVMDLFKSRSSDTEVIFDGDRNVLRLTKKQKEG